MDKENLSCDLHDQTERPGQKLPLDAHEIIKQRYLMAERLARNKCVLEVGAGHGIAMNFIANAASNYIAGEFSVENIELIKSRKPRTENRNWERQMVSRTVRNFGKVSDAVDIPDLVVLQRGSYEKFLQRDSAPNRRKKAGLENLFRDEVLKILKSEGKINNRVIENMLTWRHTGFNVFCRNRIWPDNDEGLENLA